MEREIYLLGFGVEIRDDTLLVSRTRFSAQVRRPDNDIATDRPTEGDLIYLPLANKMFEIQHVEHEQPFLPDRKFTCLQNALYSIRIQWR